MTDPKERETGGESGEGGSSDGDTQPKDVGQQGTLGEHPRVTPEQKAESSDSKDRLA